MRNNISMNTFKLAQFKAKTNTKTERRTPKHYKTMRFGLILAALMFGGVFYGMAALNTPETEAIEPSSFNAGYLIDDSVFYNPNTMTVAEIQKLLDDKSPACDMWGTGLISGRKYPDGTWVPAGTTRAQYAKVMREKYGNTKYHDPPYVCINKYYENPETHQSLYETQGIATAGMKSAAQIIYDVAKEYSINPQVLLVMVKKESLVWGDNWPLKYEYNTVMGYGCPDNAPCNEMYYGFYNQVQKAAWQLNYYREHPNAYRYKPQQNNNIQYHPNVACGTKQVYLENIATTSLYIYTPYTPNDAALRAYPGTGDDCSSYGNRNFYMFFREWFGDTIFTNQYKQISDYVKKVNYLGKEVQDGYKCSDDNCYKKFEYGYVFGTNSGAWDIHGGIYQKWKSLNAENSILGLPIENEKYQGDGIVYQNFENGRIYWMNEAAFTMHGGIYSYWIADEDASIAMIGYPIGAEEKDGNGNTLQRYTKSTIYWNNSKGTWYVDNHLVEFYVQRGGSSSYLGASMNKPVYLDANDGVMQEFCGGEIYWTSTTGAWDVHGAILKKWKKDGSENSYLGYPISREQKDAYGYTFQNFERGRIYWGTNVGIWELKDFSLDYWLELGMTASILGTPSDSGQCGLLRNSCYQMFNGGRIYWTSENGTHSIHGGILERWIKEGLEWKKLGFPISDEIYEDNLTYQIFEGGRIYWNDKKGTWID